jgi:cell division protein FtsI/penicillin-binding protein 2
MVDNQQSVVKVTLLRGAILDRVGRVLALSRPVRNVFVEAGGVIDHRPTPCCSRSRTCRGSP